MKIYKYPVPVRDSFAIRMPEGAKPLHVAVQHEQVCLWAAVDPEAPDVEHHFRLVGTGHEFAAALDRYIGTFQFLGGNLIFHLFDVGEPAFETMISPPAALGRVER